MHRRAGRVGSLGEEKIKGNKRGFCENILHIDVVGDKLWRPGDK